MPFLPLNQQRQSTEGLSGLDTHDQVPVLYPPKRVWLYHARHALYDCERKYTRVQQETLSNSKPNKITGYQLMAQADPKILDIKCLGCFVIATELNIKLKKLPLLAQKPMQM